MMVFSFLFLIYFHISVIISNLLYYNLMVVILMLCFLVVDVRLVPLLLLIFMAWNFFS